MSIVLPPAVVVGKSAARKRIVARKIRGSDKSFFILVDRKASFQFSEDNFKLSFCRRCLPFGQDCIVYGFSEPIHFSRLTLLADSLFKNRPLPKHFFFKGGI